MQTNRISLARKILPSLGAALGLILLAGCDFPLSNLTPGTLPENPSQIYTLQLRATAKGAAIVPGSVEHSGRTSRRRLSVIASVSVELP